MTLNQVGFQGVSRDITKRKEAERLVMSRNRQLTALLNAAQAMGGIPDIKTAARAICEAAVEAVGVRMAWVGLVVPEGIEVVPLTSAGLDEGYSDNVKVRWDESPRGKGPGGEALKQRRTMVCKVSDPLFDPWREEAEKRGFRSVCSIPMVHEDSVRGVFVIYDAEEDPFDGETLEILEIFARELTMVIVNTSLYSEAKETVQSLLAANEELLVTKLALAEVTRDIVFIISREGVVSYVNDAAAEAYFGISAAIDGDLVLVGAFRDNGAALDSGAAYLFDRNLGGPDAWGQLTKFVPSDAAEDDRAGLSVDIRGATVVVGAGWHDAVADKAGAAYVFDRNRSGADAWGEVMKLTASDGVVDDFLGHSGVSIGDGRVILGAYGVDGPMGTNSGVAYIFGTPFFIDGFEDGTTDSWDAAIP